MSRFIRLSTMVLNTNNIYKIKIEPSQYCIHINSKVINGGNWSISGFGIGTVSTFTYDIYIDKEKDPYDFQKVSDWINKIDT
jgi:hypothetical protein